MFRICKAHIILPVNLWMRRKRIHYKCWRHSPVEHISTYMRIIHGKSVTSKFISHSQEVWTRLKTGFILFDAKLLSFPPALSGHWISFLQLREPYVKIFRRFPRFIASILTIAFMVRWPNLSGWMYPQCTCVWLIPPPQKKTRTNRSTLNVTPSQQCVSVKQ